MVTDDQVTPDLPSLPPPNNVDQLHPYRSAREPAFLRLNSTSFSYKQDPDVGKQYFRHQANGAPRYLLLRKIDDISATLTGANSQGGMVQLPEGYTITRRPNGVPTPPVLGVFAILQPNSYVVSFNGRPVLSINNQHQQQIKCRGRGENATTAVVISPHEGFVPKMPQRRRVRGVVVAPPAAHQVVGDIEEEEGGRVE